MAYVFNCDWKAAFVPHPARRESVGYITDFDGLGLGTALKKDLTVLEPFGNALVPTYPPLAPRPDQTVTVTGVLDTLSWGGGPGDVLSFSCYMSPDNAHLLKAHRSASLKTTAIKEIGWYIASYDHDNKTWFEATYPKQPSKPAGQLNVAGKEVRLHIADEPVPVASNIDVHVFNVYFELVPAANQMASFSLATARGSAVVLPWGVRVVG
jgi:hypothetical protein